MDDKMQYQGQPSGLFSDAQFSGRLFQRPFEGDGAIYMRLYPLVECARVPQGYHKLDQVFLYSTHHLKTFKIMSKARIDTIVHPCAS